MTLYRICKREITIPGVFIPVGDLYKYIPPVTKIMYVLNINWKDTEQFEHSVKGYKEALDRLSMFRELDAVENKTVVLLNG